ncbi:hypothetical protein [Mycobacterium sp. E342]|uniref:hypothetical protein n=1 Tax=Mycobacterium sp. E342 TaxID=1834147 RepID=UPI001E5E16A8|nr:hypothetical protein [Mycobacterium sp. E342]
MAVLKAGIKPGESGLIHGENRIAELTKRVLSAAGFPAVETRQMGKSSPPETDAYDFVIETQPSSPAFDEMIRAVRPGGRIILKSRPAAPVAIDLAAAVRKEVIFESVSYGTFPESLEFLTRHDLADLLGQTYPLEDFVDVFATDRAGENLKSFLSPGSGDADPGIATPSALTSTGSAKPGIPVTAPCG